MLNSKLPKIVYLFGAGATHAEKLLECKIKKTGLNKIGDPKTGLLAGEVSERVVKKLLKNEPDTLNYYGITEFSLSDFSLALGEKDIDIELLISLLETIKGEISENHVKTCRKYFRDDISKNLFIGKKIISPKLYSSLIEWHDLEDSKEIFLGFLTLNYDWILEKSFKLTNTKINYGFNVQIDKSLGVPDKSKEKYLLKLHGSFDWYFNSDINKIIVSSMVPKKRATTVQWIPPRLNKEYLDYPYNIIHGKAFELLAGCDILRVIGCSLSRNDIGLISLLFKIQASKYTKPYLIEIIDSDERRKKLVKRLGLLLSFDESFYGKDEWTRLDKHMSKNHFLDWLYYKVMNTPTRKISGTTYLKNVKEWAKL